MNQYKSALAALLLAVVAAAPTAAEQASFSTGVPPGEALCTAACFAYLEFPPLSDTEAAASQSMPLASARDSQAVEIAARTSAAATE